MNDSHLVHANHTQIALVVVTTVFGGSLCVCACVRACVCACVRVCCTLCRCTRVGDGGQLHVLVLPWFLSGLLGPYYLLALYP